MKRTFHSVVLMCVIFGIVSAFGYILFVRVPKVTLANGTVVPGISVKDSQGYTEEDIRADRESLEIFKKLDYLPVSSDPKVIESTIYPFVRKEIRKRTGFDSELKDKDIHDACLQIAQVIASDSGRRREDFEKDLSYAKPLPLQSKVIHGNEANMSPAELFKFYYDKKFAENPVLVGMCFDDSSHFVIAVGRRLTKHDLSSVFMDVPEPPGFYTQRIRSDDGYIFHRDPDYGALVDRKTLVTTLNCAIAVKDKAGNMYPLKITVYKNPFNNRWWVHRAQRTVNIGAQNGWRIIY